MHTPTALALCLLAAPALAPAQDPPARRPSEAIAPYVAFLEKPRTSPVDYVMGLFDDHDVVILCERDHRDMTQYDLIMQLVGDPRFARGVGHVCTEVGSASLRPYVRELMATPGLSDAELRERLLHVYRDFTFFPVWEKYDYFDFMKRLYRLNETLEPRRRIRLDPSDVPFSWVGMTEEKYREFRKSRGRRDRIMADNMLASLREIEGDPERPHKLLVIMNYRHAFNDFAFADGRKGDNTGRYLFEELPGRVANVWINSFGMLPGTTDSNPVIGPVQAGRWDAAFEVAGNPACGFAFAGSPFGDDAFDLFPFRKSDVRYRDVFDGMVFYKPLREFRPVVNVPGLFDREFTAEFARREAICGRERSPEEIARFAERFDRLEEPGYDNMAEMQRMIDRWIR